MIRVLDIYAGRGGTALGLWQAGETDIEHIEIARDPCRTLSAVDGRLVCPRLVFGATRTQQERT